MDRNQKINYLVVPITLAAVVLITIILAVCKQPWDFFLVGAMTSLLTHGLMVKQNHRATRMVQLDPDHKVFKPKKSAILWCLLRMLVMVGIFVVLGFLANERGESKMDILIPLLSALGGFMILKVVFIILLVTTKEKEVK